MSDPNEALTHPTPTGSPTSLDTFESQYMARGEQVLARYRGRPTAGYHATAAFVGLVVVSTAATAMQAAVGLTVVLGLWLLFAVMRVTVTPRRLEVRYGPFGPSIPLPGILAIEATRYHWSSWGGWGIRRRLDTGEMLYAMPGDGGNGIRVRWRDARGRERAAVVGVRDPATAVAAVEAARPALAPTGEDEPRPLPSPD